MIGLLTAQTTQYEWRRGFESDQTDRSGVQPILHQTNVNQQLAERLPEFSFITLLIAKTAVFRFLQPGLRSAQLHVLTLSIWFWARFRVYTSS